MAARQPGDSRRSVVLQLMLAAVVVAVSGTFLVRAIRAEMSLSLWLDELYSIAQYSSRGVGRTVSTYTANNHIFFNLLNALTPGAGSVDPARARLWSIVATVAMPVLGMIELGRRRMLLAGALLFAVFAGSTSWLQLSLQARGYGLLALATMVIVLAVWRHLEAGRVPSLVTAATASVIGCWTLPSFAFFVGPLWLALLTVRRTRQVLVAAVAAGAVTLVVYLPVAGQLISQFTGYSDQFGEQFRHPGDVVHSVHTYLMGQGGPLVVAAWAVAAVAALGVASGWPTAVGTAVGEPLRDEVRILLVSVTAFFAICMIVRSVPPRVTAFASVALAVAGLASLGALARQTSVQLVQLAAVVVLVGSAATAIVAVRAEAEPNSWIPIEDWKGAGDYLASVFPAGTKVFADPPSLNLAGYLHDGQTLARTYDPGAFARGQMVIVGFQVLPGKTGIDPGVPYVETDLLQQRGKEPNHAMRIRFAPVARPGLTVTVADQATPQLADAELGTQFTSPPQTLLPEPYDIVVDVPAGPVRSIAIGVADNRSPKAILVSTVGPDGETTAVPKQAITRGFGAITVALGDREVSKVRIQVGRSSSGPFTLSDLWVYPP
ncbi:MAG: hypothetical protein ACXWA3_11395 [Acidimicrobiales bacterium]